MERSQLFSLDAAKMEAQAENNKRGPSPASSRYCKSKPGREPPHRAIIPDITNKTSLNQHSQLNPRMRGEQIELIKEAVLAYPSQMSKRAPTLLT